LSPFFNHEFLEAVNEPVSHDHRPFVIGMREERQKLVPAVPSEGVFPAKGILHSLGRFLENQVSLEMPVRIVNSLEMIKIDQKDRQGIFMPEDPLEFAFKRREDPFPV
jgi:hypothetical protein